MAFLTVGGTPIPCAQETGAPIDVDEIGGRERMFDASMLESVRARKQVVPLATPYVTRAIAETYKTALLAAPPISCTGDLFNNVATNCFVKYQGLVPVGVPGAQKWRVRFTLYEA